MSVRVTFMLVKAFSHTHVSWLLSLFNGRTVFWLKT